ncbi:STAS-like domain-containing protein [Vibrio parahaemolyticus]|uniref:STAS-like domain-containing protein n=2 Tax=Vibrio parahaemolyticus TaxID=670 RepID=UPI0021521D4B|nr:STAS-like domain-containing protein [Vibrio parahaemolyticus]
MAKDFSEFPFGRHTPDDGEFTGEVFREKILKPTLDKLQPGDRLTVDLDGVKIGIGSSFLSESFAGAVQKGYINKEDFLGMLNIICEDSLYKDEIIGYIKEA